MRSAFLSSVIVAALIIWAVQEHPFFWDTIQLGSKHAHFFFEHHLKWQPLPVEIDSGHPPLLGYYLAICWTLWGKSLLVSHWAMLPFLTGIFFFTYRIAQSLAPGKAALGLLLLLIADPVFGGQAILISPDLMLLFFGLLALDAIKRNYAWYLWIAILGLCLVSMRGMMVAAAFWGFVIWNEWTCKSLKINWIIMRSAAFLPGFAAATLFLGWHWTYSGWVGHHPGSAWAPAFERVGWSGFARNLLVLGWRWLDLGRFLEIGCLLWLVWYLKPAIWRGRHELDQLARFCVCLLLFLTPSALLYQNLSAHRYFLPIFFAVHVFVFYGIQRFRFKKWYLGALVLVLLSGHFWIYPKGISMDWDSTLAHVPYYNLEKTAKNWLEVQGIDFAQVGSAFPNLNSGEITALNGDQRQFVPFDFSKNKYIFVSNIYNDFSRADLEYLEKSGQLMQRFARQGVWIEVYKLKNE
jgi:hypothetical protein